jgi:hypothetical protein
MRCLFIVASLISVMTSRVDAQRPSAAPAPPPRIDLPAPERGAPPPLASPNLRASESVPKFIDWASRSGSGQRESVRKEIAATRGNAEVALELCRETLDAQSVDHSRTLILLSVVGEMRNPDGEKCLTRFIHQPFPTEGTAIAGEIVEQTSLGTLQAKAVDGLAYAGTETADREVLWAAGAHPSRIVRAEAINAYLWNRKDSQSARSALLKVVRPDERDFLDRPRHEPGMTSAQFNERLAAYAQKHPAPKPDMRAVRKLSPAEAVGDRPPPEIERQAPSPPPQGRQ